MLEKNTYKIQVNNMSKTVSIAVGELTSSESAQKFMAEYKAKTRAINTSEYVLNIDCEHMKVVTPELAGSLESAFAMYRESGFQKVRFYISNSAVLKLQFSRIARLADLTNIEITSKGV